VFDIVQERHVFDDVAPPDGINEPRWVCDDPQRRTVTSPKPQRIIKATEDG
jgi:hypothetical protein